MNVTCRAAHGARNQLTMHSSRAVSDMRKSLRRRMSALAAVVLQYCSIVKAHTSTAALPRHALVGRSSVSRAMFTHGQTDDNTAAGADSQRAHGAWNVEAEDVGAVVADRLQLQLSGG